MSDAQAGSSSSPSSTTTTKPTASKPTARADADPKGEGEAMQDILTEQENERIAANQERYDARVGGQSSAELNEEARKERAEKQPEVEAQEAGGQTVRENPGSGEPAV